MILTGWSNVWVLYYDNNFGRYFSFIKESTQTLTSFNIEKNTVIISHSVSIYRKEVSRTHRKKFNEGFDCKDRSEKVVSVG